MQPETIVNKQFRFHSFGSYRHCLEGPAGLTQGRQMSNAYSEFSRNPHKSITPVSSAITYWKIYFATNLRA